jgi:hypothetical protein
MNLRKNIHRLFLRVIKAISIYIRIYILRGESPANNLIAVEGGSQRESGLNIISWLRKGSK